jgi:DNA (cytosine-5)-methyltransferase 1
VNINAVDLFCGAGGLTRGLSNAGIDVGLGVDVDPMCEYPYATNNDGEFLNHDVTSLSADLVSEHLDGGTYRLLAGCAPCQPFSNYSRGKYNYEPEKWSLLNAFGRLVKETGPELVTMENVAQLKNHEVFLKFKQTLERSDYHVWFDHIDCHHYGLPQTRRRLVLLASRLGPIEPIAPTHPNKGDWQTVRKTIEDLPAIDAGETHGDDRLHSASSLTNINMKRIRASKPGGTWRDWPMRLVAKCHKKKSGKTYPGVYGRMAWDVPSPTMTTQCYGFGNGRFGHPQQDRAISLREAAMLQSFDRDYAFLADDQRLNFSGIGRLIGNAVPVRLGEVIGESIVQHVEQYGRTSH